MGLISSRYTLYFGSPCVFLCLSIATLATLMIVQEAALQAEKAEKEMHQKILRETAELTRAANVRHEATHSLLSHRQRSLEDKRMLAEEKKVSTLLHRVLLMVEGPGPLFTARQAICESYFSTN